MNTEFRAAWLMRSGDVLASADVADTPQSRRKGLIGRTSVENLCPGLENLEVAIENLKVPVVGPFYSFLVGKTSVAN